MKEKLRKAIDHVEEALTICEDIATSDGIQDISNIFQDVEEALCGLKDLYKEKFDDDYAKTI